MSSKWAWLAVVACGLLSIAAGVFLSWGHGRNGTLILTVVAAAGGIVLALCLVFCSLWITGPTRQRNELRNVLASTSLVQRPAVEFAYGSGVEFMSRIFADEEVQQQIAPGSEVEEVEIRIRVSETNGVWARGVRVRVVSSDPEPATGFGSLPAPLLWSSGGRPEVLDIPPGGREYVSLAKVGFYREPNTPDAEGGVLVSLPVFGWRQHESVDFTLEAFDNEGGIGQGRFRFQHPEIVDGQYPWRQMPAVTQLSDP